MSRMKGPSCRLSRREGVDLCLKSSLRALDSKCRLAKKPGQQSLSRKSKTSTYGLMLRAKQRIQRFYQMSEKQLRLFYKRSAKCSGLVGNNLMIMLESRLDNVVYRMGFGVTRRDARQLVSHGMITVNQKKVDIASYIVKPNDCIAVREKSHGLVRIRAALEQAVQAGFLDWISVEAAAMKGIFSMPLPDVVIAKDFLNPGLLVELYSR
jgi:small subunit ribosomal protein S4